MGNNFPISKQPVDESYLNDKFMNFLNTLLDKDGRSCIKILNFLCAKEGETPFADEEKPRIEPYEFGHRKPDLAVISQDCLYIIENKFWSQIKLNQLQCYSNHIKKSIETGRHNQRGLILLTPHPSCNEKYKPWFYKHIKWFEVKKVLRNLQAENTDGEELICAFCKLLDEIGTDFEIPNNEVVHIIGQCLNSNSVPFTNKKEAGPTSGSQHSASYTGYFIPDEVQNEFFCGIYWNFRRLVWFNTEPPHTKDRYRYLDVTNGMLGNTDYAIRNFGPQLEKHKCISILYHMADRFVSMGADRKEYEICKFVKTAYEEIKKFRI